MTMPTQAPALDPAPLPYQWHGPSPWEGPGADAPPIVLVA
jgi:hypothetical protein